MSLHHHSQYHPTQQNPPNPHQLQYPISPQMIEKIYPFFPKAKPQQQLTVSDDDEPGFNTEDSVGDGKKKIIFPWQRMKWTDSMIRLLIMVVFYIGDEAGSEGNNDAVAGGNKRVCGGGVVQKKGKWKSVSRVMLERGFYVSPQQCEDKFNDLNKRYKRVKDILGKGTACRVVEDQNLLDTMDHLSPKHKEEVKKLLNSKHLFFREMCAYHNSSGGSGGGSGGSGGHQSPEVAVEQHTHPQSQRQSCFDASETPPVVSINSGTVDTDGSKMAFIGPEEEENDEYEENEHGEDEDDENETIGGGGMKENEKVREEEEGIDGKCSRKRLRKGMPTLVPSPLMEQLNTKLASVVEDVTKSLREKGQWMKNRFMQIEEQRVGYQFEAFEIEKQRLKWVKFSSKKERAMERDKLKNERMRLENERLVLLLRQKELELLDLQ